MTEREVSTQEGNALAKDLGCDFVEASAKNCINVERAFYDVVRNLRRQRMEVARLERKPGAMGQNGGAQPGLGGFEPRSQKPGRTKRGREHAKCVIL